MSAFTPFQNQLILRGYRDLIPVFEQLSIRDENALMTLKDSSLRQRGYDDRQRLQILKAANKILNMELPFPNEIVYAFDVDGTLTPTPGKVKTSLWYLGPEDYYNSLSDETRDILVRMLSVLPDPLIIISRNTEENIRAFFRLLNSEFEARIDPNYSAFRYTGRYPTDGSKEYALINLNAIGKSVFYIDDSQSEIDQCIILAGYDQYLGCYHATTWLGDASEFTNMANMALQFHQQVKEMNA
jgi:hypothetical protein